MIYMEVGKSFLDTTVLFTHVVMNHMNRKNLTRFVVHFSFIIKD